MERMRDRTRSQVLLAHQEGPQTNGSRSWQLGAPVRRRRPGPRRAGKGVVTMRWLRRLLQKSRAEKELDRELRFHIERQIAAYIAAGIAPEEARRRARLEFGGLERVKEEVRDTRWETHLDNLFRDFRYALRSLRKDRRFTFIAIFALALGIGATTVMFSVVYNLLFDPFPYKGADRLMVVNIHDLEQASVGEIRDFSIPYFL